MPPPPDPAPELRVFDTSVAQVAAPLGDARCKAGERVGRDEDGRIRECFLETAHAFATAGGKDVLCAGDRNIELDRDGRLVRCWSSQVVAFDGVTCSADYIIALHPDGRLAECQLAAPIAAAGTTLPSGTHVRFHPSGSVAGADLSHELVVHGYRVRHWLELYEGGGLARIVVTERRDIAGFDARPPADVRFRPDGQIWSLEFVIDRARGPHGELELTTREIRFDCAGEIVLDSGPLLDD